MGISILIVNLSINIESVKLMSLPLSQRSSNDEPLPAVVTDRWELPHSCLKTGRVIGSGAFGQVVKGRVSKSILMHRGITMGTLSAAQSTHVTVAIKMLQGNVYKSIYAHMFFIYTTKTS